MRYTEAEEGKQRERIAAYLLCAPPLEQQTRRQQRTTRRALACLWRVESAGVLRNLKQPRRLQERKGSLFLLTFFHEAQQLLRQAGVPLRLVTPLSFPPVGIRIEPRLLQIGLVALLRDLARQGAVSAEIAVGEKRLELRFYETTDVIKQDTLQLLKETARLHKGRLAVNRYSVVLSLPIGKVVTTDPYERWDDPVTEGLLSIPSIGLRFFRKFL